MTISRFAGYFQPRINPPIEQAAVQAKADPFIGQSVALSRSSGMAGCGS